MLPRKFDRERLKMQLTLLGDLTKDKKFNTVLEVADFITSLHTQTRLLFKEIEAFVELCLCLPVSAVSSERSFSPQAENLDPIYYESKEVDASGFNACTQ